LEVVKLDTDKIEYIVQMALKRLQSQNLHNSKKAIVILEGYIDELAVLEDIKQSLAEYKLTLLVMKPIAVPGTYEAFGDVLYAEKLNTETDKLIAGFDVVILPNPSLNSISKIAHIMLDGLIPELVFSALQEGKKVLINDILNNKKFQRLSVPLKQEAQNLMNKLTGYGITKTDFCNTESSLQDTPKGEIISKRVLSLRDMEDANSKDTEIILNKDTLITPLAADYIKEKKINLRFI
jgi:ethanolamine utilization protein